MKFISFLLTTETTGIFSFLDPIINFLEDLGHFGLALYTMIEVLLIIPPIEVIYYPLILLDVDHWYLYLINVIFFNVLASMLGYFVGKKIGYPVLRYFTNDEVLGKAQKLFDKYGILAVAIGAFTPIPYTIVVFLAGITKMDFKKFIIAGFVGRVPRYIVGGYFVMKVGQSETLNRYMLILSVIGMLVFVAYYILQGFYNLYKKKKMSE
ncbi:hypothetical protein CI105_05955 [Candidatus Izimaplasma bacterium ZiA1]|uniref:YqaA family protein n=1 Tax=Candidatus Izimoplasma sp. ZiA1 TaxID=2024899 RepID=UPI000BAA4E86|nr:hypothetical protein CI105_05955 [Candidatus Izimaplasma bacterium ZiA1]